MRVTRRVAGLAAALAFCSAGSGLPMCVALVLRLAQPCAMHERHHGAPSHAGHGAPAVTGASGDHSCHPADGLGPGCTSGGTCPAGSVAAAGLPAPDLPVADVSDPSPGALLAAPASFVAPPLPPPPLG